MNTPSAPFEVRTGQRQLFVDDTGVSRLDNLTRTLHQPAKKGPVIRVDPGLSGLEQHSIQTNSVPIWNQERECWQLWCSVPSGVQGSGCFESPDLVNWHKPILGKVEHRGSRNNHHVAFSYRGKTYGPRCVVYDPTDPDPSRRYKNATYAEPGILFAVSPDGIDWKGLDEIDPIPSQDTYSLWFDQENHLFILKVKHEGPHGRSAYLCTSSDFATWTPAELVFHADEEDQRIGREVIEAQLADPHLRDPEFNDPETYNTQVYNLGIFSYEGVYIGMPMMYYRAAQVPKGWDGFAAMDLPPQIQKYVGDSGDWTGVWHIQLMASRNLRDWQRLGERQPFLTPSPTSGGAYDTLCLSNPAGPVEREDELWFFYNGIRSYALTSLRYRDQGAINLAVLRRDGFMSLDAGDTGGTLTTEPFAAAGDRLFVNVDAASGELAAHVLDDQGSMIAESQPISGDRPRAEVSWLSGGFGASRGTRVRLRFVLRNASLYSYWLDDDG
jgi:hypothetical protein